MAVDRSDVSAPAVGVAPPDGAERGVLIPSEAIILNGVNLWKDGDAGTKVAFHLIGEGGEIAETPTAEVTNFVSKGPNALKFAWPAALEQGKAYMAYPARTADGERWYTGTGKAATVKEG